MQANKNNTSTKNKLGSNPLVDNVLKQVIGEQKDANFNNTKSSQSEIIDSLHRRLKELQGIKSITYRFPVEEIAEFDQMVSDLQKALGGKRVSKNDVIRTAVNLILEDWHRHQTSSIIIRLLKKRIK